MFRKYLTIVILGFMMPGLLLFSVNMALGRGDRDPQHPAAGQQKYDQQHQGHVQGQQARKLPPYYENVAGVDIPKTLSPEKFQNPATQQAYEIARDNPKLLMQLPCFCPCDRPEVGHKSLLDCFVDTHGENCTICRDEALTAAKLQKQNWNILKIREKIIEDYSKSQH